MDTEIVNSIENSCCKTHIYFNMTTKLCHYLLVYLLLCLTLFPNVIFCNLTFSLLKTYFLLYRYLITYTMSLKHYSYNQCFLLILRVGYQTQQSQAFI